MQSLLLIYDGECPLCRRAVAWVRAHSAEGVFDYMPCQSAERAVRAPSVAYEACMEAMQLVLQDGTVRSGADAFPHILRRARGYAWLGALLEWRIGAAIAPIVYRWVARRRLALSGLFKEKAAGESCTSDGRCDL